MNPTFTPTPSTFPQTSPTNPTTNFASSTPNSNTDEQSWVSELTTRAHVLRYKRHLLENSIAKADEAEILTKIADIRSVALSFAGTDILIMPNADEITKIIKEATHSCDIIEAALKVNTPPSSSSHGSNGYPGEECGIKLKAMNPPVYHGDEENWLPFWEQFNAMVHSRKLPDSSKHRILIDECLKGEALKCVKGINPNSRNYQTSIAALKERFGNHDKLASFYYKKLDKMSPSQDARDQLSTFEEVSKILANLASLDVSTEETFLREKIIQKFSSSTLMWVWAILENNDSPNESSGSVISRTSVESLMAALGKVVHRRQDIQHYLRDVPSTSAQKKAPKGGNGPAEPALAGFSAAPNPASEGLSCVFCKKQHQSENCKRFGTLKKRRARLVDLRKCLVCGHKGHRAAACPSKACSFCKKTNHSIITCVEYLISKNPAAKNTAKGKSSSNLNIPQLTNLEGTFIETFTCKVRDADGNYIVAKGMLDGGSATSFITNSLTNKLRLKRTKRTLSRVCNFGSKKVICQSSDQVEVNFKNHCSEVKSFRLKTTECISGVVISSPPPACVRSILPDNLSYADPGIFTSNLRTFDILIGIDLYNKLVNLTTVKRLPCGIFLKDSFFGWVPSGSLDDNEILTDLNETSKPVFLTLLLATTNTLSTPKLTTNKNDELDKLCSLYWSLEVLGIRSSQLEEVNESVLQHHRETVTRDEDGRFVVRWPYKKESPSLPSNYRLSLARLKKIFEKWDSSALEECNKNFLEQLKLGIIEKVPIDSPYLKHYIPWKPVFRNNKIRIVYDASAKTKSGISLNDLMHTGPKLIGDLVSLLINFRLFEIGITADIEKAFLMVGLNVVDRDVTRFLWVKDLNKPATPDNICIYRFARTPFGVIASPFLLNIVLQDLLTSPNKWLSMSRNSFYVDNLLLSVPSTIDAVNLHDAVKPKLASAGFNLRDWTSNDEKFIRAVPGSLQIDSNPISVLGLDWNRKDDTLAIRVNWTPNSNQITKRNILKFVSSVYDPLMLTAPATLPIKILIQECWKEKITWDELLPVGKQARYFKLYNEISRAISTNFQRRYWTFEGDGTVYLHIFSDASKDAYACCAYLSYSDELKGHFSSSLVLAKSRLAPPRGLTIPNLELLGVLIGKRIAKYLLSSFKLTIDKLVLWTDATTVIHWLNSPNVQSRFVEARINEIREPLDSALPIKEKDFVVKYVPGESNPADLATRGVKAEQLFNNPLWWKGPAWLPYPRLWPSPPTDVRKYSCKTIPSHAIMLINSSVKPDHFLPDSFEKRFASWDKYARLYGLIIRWCAKVINIPDFDSETDVFQRGERALIRAIQFKYYQPELSKLRRKIQPNHHLGLFLDDMGIIRCKGRLQNANFPWETIHPILLPRDSPLTALYIQKIHNENMHVGCSHVLSKLREKFWIIKGRAKVKSVLHKCVTCRMWFGGSYQLPEMPPLPWSRVTEASPFLHIGVDLFGPLNCFKDDNITVYSVYVVIFVCFVTRAIHLELANDLTANEFLLAFIRFSSRRGCPKLVYSDNGKNLKFVQRLVASETKITDVDLRRHFSTNNIRWKFAPPNNEHYRGAIERLIGVAKPSLKKSFGRKQILNYTALNTALCELENIINSRPLTYVSEEPLQVLTPNHFLRLRTVNANNIPEVSKHRIPRYTRKDMLKTWEETRAIVEDFWSAFRGLYLLSLRGQHDMTHKPRKGSAKYVPKKDHLVLIQHPSAPRCDWPTGRVISVDHRAATARVLVRRRELDAHREYITKSVNQLFPFELGEYLEENSNSEKDLPSTSKRIRKQ